MIDDLIEFLLQEQYDYGMAPEWSEEDLRRLYELTYKYQMARTHAFSGLPQREANIVRRIEQELIGELGVATEALAFVLDNWLAMHTVSDPEAWARNRVSDTIEELGAEETIKYAVGEYARYSGQTGKFDPDDMLRRMVPNVVSKSESLQSLLDDWRNDRIEMAREDAEEDEESDLEGTISAYKDMDYDDLWNDLMDAGFEVGNVLAGASDPERILVDIYQYAVFPFWYKNWKDLGIDETIERVQKVRSDLDASRDDPLQWSAAVNMALHTTHHTGDMLDYIEQSYPRIDKQLLDELSDLDTYDIDAELRQMGFQIPTRECVLRAINFLLEDAS